jgi:hypothetical protein
MKTKGQFTLFETLAEFATFLDKKVDRDIGHVLEHHTAEPSYDNFNGKNHFALLEGMKAFHTKAGFGGIAQNLTTFPDGTVAICRPLDQRPACTRGANTRGICIENLGNFDKNADQMTPAQRTTIVQVTALLCRRFKIPVDTDHILYHHWYNLATGERNNGTGGNKSCPGSNFFGGNKVQHCKANFIPLVSAALQQLTGPIPVATVRSPDGILSIRGAPTAKAVERGTLTNGAVVQIHEAKGIWRRIDPVEQHWVSSKFLVSG